MYNHYVLTKCFLGGQMRNIGRVLIFIRFIVGFWFGVTVVSSQLIVGHAGLFRFCKAALDSPYSVPIDG